MTSARRKAIAPFLAAAIVCAAVLPGVGTAAKKAKRPPPTHTFADIPWLVPADTALARLAARGYRPVPEAKDKDRLVCRGKLFEHDAIATGYLDEQGRLVRMVVLITNRGQAYNYPDMRAVFDEVVHETESHSGPPRTVVEKYRFPYERGDGREDEALRDDKATIRWQWAVPGADRLSVEMDRTCTVVVSYESPEWIGVEARRRARKAADL